MSFEVVYLAYAFIWWVIGCLLTLLGWKMDKSPVFVKDLGRMALTGLLGLLVLVIWLIARIGTWLENHQDKRIF